MESHDSNSTGSAAGPRNFTSYDMLCCESAVDAVPPQFESPLERCFFTKEDLFQCIICSIRRPIGMAVKIPCGHQTCRRCLRRPFEMSINRAEYIPLKCCGCYYNPLEYLNYPFNAHFRRRRKLGFWEYSRNHEYTQEAIEKVLLVFNYGKHSHSLGYTSHASDFPGIFVATTSGRVCLIILRYNLSIISWRFREDFESLREWMLGTRDFLHHACPQCGSTGGRFPGNILRYVKVLFGFSCWGVALLMKMTPTYRALEVLPVVDFEYL